MKVQQRLAKTRIAARKASFPEHSHQRILVVDHDDDVRQLSVDVLSESSYDVEAVASGSAGWRALQHNQYDLIITENAMPGMTGMEMIEKLRSANIALPVIMATKHLPRHELARKPWLKPAATLPRPFSIDDLLAAVKTVLHRDSHTAPSCAITPEPAFEHAGKHLLRP